MVVGFSASLTKLTWYPVPATKPPLGGATVSLSVVPSTKASRVSAPFGRIAVFGLTRSIVKFNASVLTRCQVTWLGPAVVHAFEVPGVRIW